MARISGVVGYWPPLLPPSYGGALTPQVAPTTSLMAWDCHVIPTREEGCDPERRQQSDYTTRNTSNCSKHATHNKVCITSQLKTSKREIQRKVSACSSVSHISAGNGKERKMSLKSSSSNLFTIIGPNVHQGGQIS